MARFPGGLRLGLGQGILPPARVFQSCRPGARVIAGQSFPIQPKQPLRRPMTSDIPNQASFQEVLSQLLKGASPVLPNALCEFRYQWNFSTNEGLARLVSIDGCPTHIALPPTGIAGKLAFMSDIPPTPFVVGGQTVFLNRVILDIDLDSGRRSAAVIFNQDGSCIEASATWNDSKVSATTGAGPASSVLISLANSVQSLVEEYIAPLIDTGAGPSATRAPGGIVGIYFGGEPYFFSYGVINEAGEAPTPDTIFPLGSVTKVLTTSILGQRADLFSSPVYPVLRPVGYAFQVPEQPVTFEQLATFTGGIPTTPPGHSKTCTQDEFVAFINSVVPPGGVLPAPNVYSNSSIGVVGQALMAIKGAKEFGAETALTWYQDSLLNALSMVHTQTLPVNNPALSAAYVYDEDSGSYQQVEHSGWCPWGPAGRLFSTASDMVNFIMANVGVGTINGMEVPAEILDGMKQAQLPRTQMGSPSENQQAFAWVVRPSGIVGKNGGLPGCSSYVAVSPAHALGAVVLTNQQGVPVADSTIRLVQGLIRLASPAQ